MSTEQAPQQAEKQSQPAPEAARKITLEFSLPKLSIDAPGLKSSLKNVFNAKALVLGGLTALSIVLGVEMVWSLQVALGGAHSIGALAHAGLFAAGGAAGLWNAHSVGSKSVLFNNVALNGVRNIGFMGGNFMGAAMLAAFPAVALLGGASISAGFVVAAAIGVAAAVWGAKNLKWTPEKPQAPQPEETPRLKGPIRLSKQQPDATPAP